VYDVGKHRRTFQPEIVKLERGPFRNSEFALSTYVYDWSLPVFPFLVSYIQIGVLFSVGFLMARGIISNWKEQCDEMRPVRDKKI
jgi:hypothetical protein